MDHELLTADELGQRLRLSPDTLILWARNGRIPARRFSRKVIRFCLADVIAALDAATSGKPSPMPAHLAEADR